MKKLSSYWTGKVNATFEAQDKAEQEVFKQKLSGMTELQRFRFLTNILASRLDLLKLRHYYRHRFTLLIDLDNTGPDGMPTFRMDPKHGTLEVGKTWHIDVAVRKAGQTKVLGGAQIGPTHG